MQLGSASLQKLTLTPSRVEDGCESWDATALHGVYQLAGHLGVRDDHHRLGARVVVQLPGHGNDIRTPKLVRVVNDCVIVSVLDGLHHFIAVCLPRRARRPEHPAVEACVIVQQRQQRTDSGSSANKHRPLERHGHAEHPIHGRALNPDLGSTPAFLDHSLRPVAGVGDQAIEAPARHGYRRERVRLAERIRRQPDSHAPVKFRVVEVKARRMIRELLNDNIAMSQADPRIEDAGHDNNQAPDRRRLDEQDADRLIGSVAYIGHCVQNGLSRDLSALFWLLL